MSTYKEKERRKNKKNMDLITTPERNRSRRISMDEQNFSDGQTSISNHEKRSLLSTPSPPRDKHNQTRHNPSFLATPIQNHVAHPEDEDNHTDETHSHKLESVLSPYTYARNHSHNHTLSPIHKSRLLPPTTPKTRNTEMFLSPSPKLKSPNGNSSLITKDTKPIREISNDLKTRLNYAFVKLQNGWVDKTLPELEETLDQNSSYGTTTTTKVVKSPEKFKSPIKRKTSNANNIGDTFPSSYVNQFAYGNGDDFIPSNQSQSDRKSFGSIKQFNSKFNANLSGIIENSRDICMEDSTTSAHLAFLQALASPSKKTQDGEIPRNTSPLKWGNTNNNNNNRNNNNKNQIEFNKLKTPKLDKYGKSIEGEKEVVETLMSLSSPHKPSNSKNSEDSNTNSEETDVETESDND